MKSRKDDLLKVHPKYLIIRLSKCCNGSTYTIPAYFYDPIMIFCRKCNTECVTVDYPLYQEVSKGTYRKIEYDFMNDVDKKNNHDK